MAFTASLVSGEGFRERRQTPEIGRDIPQTRIPESHDHLQQVSVITQEVKPDCLASASAGQTRSMQQAPYGVEGGVHIWDSLPVSEGSHIPRCTGIREAIKDVLVSLHESKAGRGLSSTR
jgi:hypothetical protein